MMGCLPDAPSPTPLPPTATATLTPTATATIVWFPPTATDTPAPTQPTTPTPDLLPFPGAVLFEDPFTDQTQWPASRTGAGSVAYGKGELTLAVSEDRGTLLSLRKSTLLTDFYLQIDALPSLCRAEDAYGLLLRASSSQDFYRLLVNCNGRLRLERLKGGRSLPLQDWMLSGQIFPGGMLRTHLAVWAQGAELRVFVNDVYQFSVRDPVWSSGTVGLFARSAGDTPLTVSFSNLVVYAVSPGQRSAATPAARPSPTPTRVFTATKKP
jgi:hypothetical protein